MLALTVARHTHARLRRCLENRAICPRSSVSSSTSDSLLLSWVHGTGSSESGPSMPLFAACLLGRNGSRVARADCDSVSGELLCVDEWDGRIDGAAWVRGTSRSPMPQLLQKFACPRLVAEQRGHCMGSSTPQASQK